MNMTMRHMTSISAPKASLVAVNPRGDPHGMARGTPAAIRKAHMNGTDGAYNTNTNATVDPDRSSTPLLTYAKQAISLPYALVPAIPRAPEHDRGHEHEHDHNEDDDHDHR